MIKTIEATFVIVKILCVITPSLIPFEFIKVKGKRPPLLPLFLRGEKDDADTIESVSLQRYK